MLKSGCIVLSLWVVVNLFASIYVVADTLLLGGHTPAITAILSVDDVSRLSSETLATIDSIAIFANGINIAFSVVSLFVIWMALIRKVRWAFWGLLGSFSVALMTGVLADYQVGSAAPEVNVISGVILLAGFMAVAPALLRG